LQDTGFHYFSFIMMALAIETMGAFLDTKPFRAQSQSKKRFSAAIRKLFDRRYIIDNRTDWLYEKLRNHFAHTMVPSSWLILTSVASNRTGKEHLSFHDDKLVLVAEDFYNDMKKAAERLIRLIEQGKAEGKRIILNTDK
ncbi:MAG: hypothetical protein KJ607_03980, partial [Bacteroidetes bacterium]|nr:hypothetical protein [Bacteroidota bacterium]